MKRIAIGILMAACLLFPGIASAETEEERRVEIQGALMKLEEAYASELLPQDQMQLSFLIDWADRYTQDSEYEWEQFARDFGLCKSAEELSETLYKAYIGITQAQQGQMQREEIMLLCEDIIQSAGLDTEQIPYTCIGNKGTRPDGNSAGWYVIVSDIPGDQRYTPQVDMEFDGDGHLQYMQYCFEEERIEKPSDGAAIQAEQAQSIAREFIAKYVCSEVETSCLQKVYEGRKGDPYWEILCKSQEAQWKVGIGSETGCVYFVEPY